MDDTVGDKAVTGTGLESRLESPSLALPGAAAGPAFELKFLVNEDVAEELQAWARARLAPDPNGEPELDGAYHTTSLYFDTPELDVYLRTPAYKRRKFRVRRYGISPLLFLERKSKWGDRVAKRRSSISDEEVPLLAHPMSLTDWPAHWFHKRLVARRLSPACQVAYQRMAYVGACPESPLRLTFDRHVRGVLTSEWSVNSLAAGLPLLDRQVIVEFKFCSALPGPFKEIISELRLSPRTVSKYRLCRVAWGLPALLRGTGDA